MTIQKNKFNMKNLILIPFCSLVLIGCGNNDETTIQEVNPISNLDPISNEPGDVTIVSEKSGIT